MCPYARFQSAMFDKDTLIISYDEKRGEPRGRREKAVDPAEAGLGDCVGCQQCVQVCPTGIDIRDGLQYQCIGCAACIDTCDTVMEKMGYEKGLIRYTTEHQLAGNETKLLRPRIVLYALLLITLVAALGYSIFTRVPLELDIIRDRNALYRETSDGMIQNVYTLKVINMDDQEHRYRINATGLEGLQLLGAENVIVPSGGVSDLVVKIEVDPEKIPVVSNVVEFHIIAVENPELEQRETARFLGPLR
jgi:cytochrome c oxidase accessory protein FixG